MAKKILIKTKCPVCKYEYHLTEYYEDVERKIERVTLRKRNGKDIKLPEKLKNVSMIYWSSKDVKKYYKKVYEFKVEEVYSKSEVTKGDKEFIKIVQSPDLATELYGNSEHTSYSGMFCPQCGVFLNVDICQTKEIVKE